MITVRFSETEGYDIRHDCDVAKFMATTDLGTFHTEVIIDGPRSMRRLRKAFKERAIEYIRAGAMPCYIDISEYDA